MLCLLLQWVSIPDQPQFLSPIGGYIGIAIHIMMKMPCEIDQGNHLGCHPVPVTYLCTSEGGVTLGRVTTVQASPPLNSSLAPASFRGNGKGETALGRAGSAKASSPMLDCPTSPNNIGNASEGFVSDPGPSSFGNNMRDRTNIYRERFGFLARSNLKNLHDFGEGNIKWRNFKALIVSTHYTNNKIKILNRLRRLRSKHLNTFEPISPVKTTQVIYVIYNIHSSSMMYVGQSYRTAFIRFQEHVREARKIFRKNSLVESSKPLYAAMAKSGFESFRCFPIEHIEGNFNNARDFFKVARPRELFWMRTLHTFFPKGFNLEGKSIHRNSCRIHKKNPMMWRIHPKSGNIFHVEHSHISTLSECT